MQTCKNCGKEIMEPQKGVPSDLCSNHCYDEWRKWYNPPNTICPTCGKEFYSKPSALKRAKWGVCCSKECSIQLKSYKMIGEGNHQFGLIGDKNASFKGMETISNYGYILEYCPNHPYPHDRSIKGTRVLQHRLVIERNHDKFNSNYFEEINGFIVLKQCYDVHHKDENKTNNSLDNLEILLRSEHTTHHNLEKEIIRNPDNGRIIGVSKLDKIGEA